MSLLWSSLYSDKGGSRKLDGLKWFGSLTNLSNFRPSEKANIKAAPEHDGILGGAKSAAQSQSVDDMEPCLHIPSYAHSGEMYTHVGTVPRSQRKKKSCKGLKEKKRKEQEGEEGESGRQNQRNVGEHVRESPLLSALSGLSLTSLNQPLPVPALARLLPATPVPGWASPLTSGPECCFNDPPAIKSQEALSGSEDTSETDRPVKEPSNMATNGPKLALLQDVYVPMDPIAETFHSHLDNQSEKQRGITNKQETTKTVNVFQEVESTDSCQNVKDCGGEYVKFSKDKFWLEPPPEKLRKQLEEELKLSGNNLKSHAWYHGRIPWEVSESLVMNHGDFLIRDSQSSQGDFVLTSHWEQKTLHFLIGKMVVQSGETYSRVQYSLEGEAFDSLPALVHFYVGSRAALTRWSGAQICRPVNRTRPLSYLETAFCTVVSPPSCHRELKNGSVSGEERVCPTSPSSLYHREADVNREQDDRPLQTAGESSLSTLYNNTPQSRSPSNCLAASVAPSPSLPRRLDTSQPLPSPNSTLQRQCNDRHQPHLNQDSPSSDAGGSCYTELYPGPQSYVERLRVEEGSVVTDPLRVENGNVYFSPVVETVSSFKPSRYQSPLIPKENKPLEVSILRRVKELMAEVDPRRAAKHITKADCMVARILEVTPEVQRMMGVCSGMELLTLPHGQQLRLDLLERFQTMAIMLAVDVLGCTGTIEERAGLLHKVIQIAAELKSTMGNMFGFAAVMRALELPQVSRLEQTWTVLRQRHTEGAILYEKTLRPFMKSLNDGRESCPLSNTTFPHILPLLYMLEKSMAVGEGTEPWEMVEVGVDVVMFHLGAARTIAQLGGIYCSNVESKLQDFQEQAEVLELFLTDFQMRLLWGSRGSKESQALRYAKFDQVLTALSNKLEPPIRLR